MITTFAEDETGAKGAKLYVWTIERAVDPLYV